MVWLRILRRRFPTKNPVVLKSMDLRAKHCAGICYSNEGGHLIVVDVGYVAPIGFYLDTLVHEYAHALQWEAPGRETDDHDDKFGRLYARIIRYAYAHRLWA